MRNNSTLCLALAAVASISLAAFAEDPKTETVTETTTENVRGFTGSEEPKTGDMYYGGKLAGPVRTERAAFLGVGAIGVDPALRAQLELPKGIGLTISFVEKDGPAEKAGLQQHDILQKLNDQILVNAPQLATLVRTFKAGDTVTLGIIRKGKPMELKATLIERDLPPLADAGDPFTINFAREPLRIEDGNVTFRRQNLGNLGPARIWVDQLEKNNPRVIRLSPDSTRQISRDDGTHSIQLSTRGGQTTLTVRDNAGKVLFDGPYNTLEEQEKLAPELREKVKKMQEGIEFKPVSPTTNPSEPKADADQWFGRYYFRSGQPT